MSATRGFGVYNLMKVRMDLGKNGAGGKVFAYCVLDPGSIRLFHGRFFKEDSPPRGIKTFWRDFCSFVDADLVPLPERPAPEDAPGAVAVAEAPELPDAANTPDSDQDEVSPVAPVDGAVEEEKPVPMEVSLLQSLRQTLEDSGIYDVREENLSKVRHLEEAFARVGVSFDKDGCVAFLKVEGLSTLEAEELLSCFPEESAKEDFWVPKRGGAKGNKEVREIPRAVFPCHAVVAPVGGVPASELLPGDMVTISIPKDSLLYSIVKFQRGGGFSGNLDIPLETVKPGEGERIILEFNLSDEISAVAVVQSNLRIRAVRGDRAGHRGSHRMSPAMQQGFIFGSIGLIALIALLILFAR